MADKEKISSLSTTELESELLELRKEQFNLRMQRGTGQLANPSRFKSVRRDIARIKTRMTEIDRSSA
ncbi:MAG: 50S ribosomal protein L29 [Pseudomonadota bacterium]|jgi:large subunit ribosomal protein L29|nr:50S ribosomal protein L29 [Acidiferrobacteraceae bacterium]MCS5574674.1 50S ribosomal protein L29 [Pseudomonadales bacterium]MEE2610919.1 50S ribosomal protein L29 [Pseudomonadota bacterium]HAG47219.1 50S ribosomal protein L29 [Gammaproteobacteria bacterium]HAU10117.1 50S ribosomal protein L29 [Gammaproteobacteria bacterium]|tara:strand:+ start:1075 stop:1275 length:201 start_codon:yes stop_codon:yes gene_type:complete